jgi:hypothetical protein
VISAAKLNTFRNDDRGVPIMGLRNHTSAPKGDPTEEELDESDRIIDALRDKHGTDKDR